MRFLIVGVVLAAFAASPAVATGSHRVRGHVTSAGTYVAPTRATNPNSTTLDNYSTRGNVNPYSGREGTRDPLAPKRRHHR